MPLTNKGIKIKKEIIKEYGNKKGNQVFYSMENSGKLKNVRKKQIEAIKNSIKK